MNFDPISIVVLGTLTIVLIVVARIDRRAAKNEQRLIELLRHFGMGDVKYPAPSDEVLALLAKGKKTAAIQRYRSETGLGLKEAVDGMEDFSASASAVTRG